MAWQVAASATCHAISATWQRPPNLFLVDRFYRTIIATECGWSLECCRSTTKSPLSSPKSKPTTKPIIATSNQSHHTLLFAVTSRTRSDCTHCTRVQQYTNQYHKALPWSKEKCVAANAIQQNNVRNLEQMVQVETRSKTNTVNNGDNTGSRARGWTADANHFLCPELQETPQVGSQLVQPTHSCGTK